MHPLAQIEVENGVVSRYDRTGQRMGMTEVNRDRNAVGEPPCTGCPHFARCRKAELSCAQFAAYIETNSFGGGAREPSRALYRAMMRT